MLCYQAELKGDLSLFYTYKDFEKYEHYRKGPPALPWLPEFEKWLSEYYGVEVLPCAYEKRISPNSQHAIYNIRPVLLRRDDAEKVYTKTFKSLSCENTEYELKVMSEKAFSYAQKYNLPKVADNKLFRVLHCEIYLESYRDLYLLKHQASKVLEQEDLLLKYNISCFMPGIPMICIFKTISQAKDFIVGGGVSAVRKYIFDNLKVHDQFDFLKENDIQVFVDYQENRVHIPMYSRWVCDMTNEEMEKYIIQILNS